MGLGLFTSPTDERPWGRILRASTAIVALSRRAFGFWGYPTNAAEMRTFFPFPDAQTDEQIAAGTFSYIFGSYTVTWFALLALEEIYGSVPGDLLRQLKDVFGKLESDGGGYGRPVLLRGAGSVIHSTARHTAMALLIRLQFLPDYRRAELLDSVKWILKNQSPTTGGWGVIKNGDTRDEALSTAACIGALTTFLTGGKKTERGIDAEHVSSIERAVTDAFGRLLALRNDFGLWETPHPLEPEIVNSAFIVELLSARCAQETLQRLVPEFETCLHEFRLSLQHASLETGWPESPGAKEPSLAASISAVFVLREAVGGSDVRLRLENAEKFIVEQIQNHDGGRLLWSWDWLVLARLAQGRALFERSGISEAERFDYLSKLDGIHERAIASRLIAYLSSNAPKEADPAAIFLLSKGRPNRAYLLIIRIGRPLMNNWLIVWKIVHPIVRWAIGAIKLG